LAQGFGCETANSSLEYRACLAPEIILHQISDRLKSFYFGIIFRQYRTHTVKNSKWMKLGLIVFNS
jgi:hypothetical protein